MCACARITLSLSRTHTHTHAHRISDTHRSNFAVLSSGDPPPPPTYLSLSRFLAHTHSLSRARAVLRKRAWNIYVSLPPHMSYVFNLSMMTSRVCDAWCTNTYNVMYAQHARCYASCTNAYVPYKHNQQRGRGV